MAITAKEVLELFGFEGDAENATIEELEQFKDTTYIGRKIAATDPDIISQATGRVTGAALTAAKRGAKSLGIEINPDDIKGMKIEETIDFINEKVAAKLQSLEETAKSGNDKKANEALAALEDWKKKYKEIEELSENRLNELNTIKQNAASEIKNYKISDKFGKIKSSIPFSENANELTLKGFDNHLKENFIYELDENENPVMLSKDGSRIISANKIDFETPENIIKREADKFGILKKNNANPANPPIVKIQTQPTNTDNNTQGFAPNKRALANAEALKQQA